MNILILSVGVRNKLVRYAKEIFSKNGGKVICGDCSNLAPALYEGDKFYITPLLGDSNYITEIISICIKEEINAVISLIDPELYTLASNKNLFSKIGVEVIVSNVESVKLSFNKIDMYNYCIKNDINVVKSYESFSSFQEGYIDGEISFPVFVKPICGSCSIDAQIVRDITKLKSICESNDSLMIQEFMETMEIGCDVYIDAISKKPISIFTKRKIKMKSGETDKSVAFKDEILYEFIKDIINKMDFLYQIDIDIFEKNGIYYLSEINPRFGGGYLHAYEAGCDFFNYLYKNLNSIENEDYIGMYKEGTIMLKFVDVKMI